MKVIKTTVFEHNDHCFLFTPNMVDMFVCFLTTVSVLNSYCVTGGDVSITNSCAALSVSCRRCWLTHFTSVEGANIRLNDTPALNVFVCKREQVPCEISRMWMMLEQTSMIFQVLLMDHHVVHQQTLQKNCCVWRSKISLLLFKIDKMFIFGWTIP